MTPPYHPPKKYSVRIEGHRTSISLEPVFWDMLCAAAEERAMPVSRLIAEIDAERIRTPTPPGLAGALRIWLVTHCCALPVSRQEKGGEPSSAAPSSLPG